MTEFQIRDLDTLRALTDPVRLAILELLSEPGTVTSLAQALGVPRTRLYRHLHRLEEAGLVETIATRRVRGTTESSYRAVADRFVPAPELLEAASVAEVAEAALGIIFDTTRAELGALLRSGAISLDQSGSDERTVSLGRQVVRLTANQANQLIAEVEDKMAQLAEAHGAEKAEPYVFQFVVHRSGGTLG